MNEEIDKKIQELYDSIMYFPNKVLEIFNDFFGEEHVDMQGFPDLEGLRVVLNESNLREFFPTNSAVTGCPEFICISEEHKDRIMSLLSTDVLKESVLRDESIAINFLPIMRSALIDKLPKGFILVHFPEVQVTNEHDKYVDITHLWVKVELKFTGAGVGWFSMNRSEYPVNQMSSDYMHSHIPGIPFDNFTKFKSPCLGSGPIKNTVATLAMGYDEAMWHLFCLELDKYVRVESVAGVPHRHLEKIGSNGGISQGEFTFSINNNLSNIGNSIFNRYHLMNFVKYLIDNNKFKFNFINGSYGIAMPYLDYRIMLSNEFIKWYNKQYIAKNISAPYNELIAEGIIKECIINNGKISYFNSNRRNYRDYLEYEGKLVCYFKGKPITLHVIAPNENKENKTVLISAVLTDCITKGVLYIVNYKYGRKESDARINAPIHYL